MRTMNKILTILSIAIIMGMSTSVLAAPMVMEMGVAEQIDEQAPSINVDGNSVTIIGANGMALEVVSLTGRAVATYKIDSQSQRIDLNLPKGCYILKVGKTVRKVTIR